MDVRLMFKRLAECRPVSLRVINDKPVLVKIDLDAYEFAFDAVELVLPFRLDRPKILADILGCLQFDVTAHLEVEYYCHRLRDTLDKRYLDREIHILAELIKQIGFDMAARLKSNDLYRGGELFYHVWKIDEQEISLLRIDLYYQQVIQDVLKQSHL